MVGVRDLHAAADGFIRRSDANGRPSVVAVLEGASAATEMGLVTRRRKVIVHIATSADGYIARSDGDLEWLTSRPAPKGFYGINAFMKSVDTTVLGRKPYEVSLRLGAKFDSQSRNIVFSRHPLPGDAPAV